MKMLRFQRLTILPKIMTISVISVTVMLAATFAYYIPVMELKIMEGKRNVTKNVVEVAFGILAQYDDMAKSGVITQAEARRAAVVSIRNLRYGSKEYFWINDLEPRMVMHPTMPEFDGRNLSGYRDSKGKLLFRDFVAVAKKNGSGFVEYTWPKPGEKAAVDKISYVKLYEPWGWIIGTGIYLDDVYSDILLLRVISIAGAVLFSILTLSMAYIIGNGITRRLGKVIGGLKEIASGKGDVDLTKRIAITSIDEIGILSTEFNGLMESISSLTGFKKVIEEDDTIEDVYSRLWDVFNRELDLAQCVIYEVDLYQNSMKPVYPLLVQDMDLQCNLDILPKSELCKARKTGHQVSSLSYPHICKQFLSQDGKAHFCLPMSIGGGTVGVTQFVVEVPPDPAKREELERRIFKAEQFVKEALPVIETKRLMKTLRESALSDSLTGLHNRRFLQECAEGMCAGAIRRGKSIGLLMCDLDYFKQINDDYGHNVGDELLRLTAQTLKGSVRAADLVIRFGGEEFLVVLIDIEHQEVFAVAEKIRLNVMAQKLSTSEGTALQKTISIGISHYPTDSEGFWQAIKFADVALYRSKEDGRNRSTPFEHSMWSTEQF
jgi:diguanylate cyclase (GGDEF)-like protein